jgi:hypothetical protein
VEKAMLRKTRMEESTFKKERNGKQLLRRLNPTVGCNACKRKRKI